MQNAQQELRSAMAQRTGTSADDWFLVYRARHGMLACMRVLHELRGAGSVITQLLTCCTAVDPIIAAGLRPIYGDVCADSYALDSEVLPSADDVLGIVDQHTFGYIDEASSARLRAAADARGALLLEDCAHCVGRMATGPDGAPTADLSFHSFGVEKMLPTYFGGAVWVNPAMRDRELHDALMAALAGLPEPDARLARAMRRYRTQIRVLNHLPHALSGVLRRWMEARGLFEAAISPEEMAGKVAHEPLAMNEWACEQVLGPLRALGETDALRVRALDAYARELADKPGLRTSDQMLRSGQPLLRLPVTMPTDAQADKAIAGVAGVGLYAVPWYRPLLYPGVSDAAAYGFDQTLTGLPETARLTGGAVALPCDLSDDQVHGVVEALCRAAEAR